jgi:hypothetical protein
MRLGHAFAPILRTSVLLTGATAHAASDRQSGIPTTVKAAARAMDCD